MSGAADLIVTGRIYTVDRTRPWAEAMAVRDGRILAVGTADGLAAFRGPDTETIDLGDAFVMPGLVDVHNHHAHAGRAELFGREADAEGLAEDIVAERHGLFIRGGAVLHKTDREHGRKCNVQHSERCDAKIR